jgi:hypothetical protein
MWPNEHGDSICPCKENSHGQTSSLKPTFYLYQIYISPLNSWAKVHKSLIFNYRRLILRLRSATKPTVTDTIVNQALAKTFPYY